MYEMSMFWPIWLNGRPHVRARTHSLSGNNLTSLEGRILTSKPPMSPPIPALKPGVWGAASQAKAE
jgi:hypothetical protein